jgi:hypothetical protein
LKNCARPSNEQSRTPSRAAADEGHRSDPAWIDPKTYEATIRNVAEDADKLRDAEKATQGG